MADAPQFKPLKEIGSVPLTDDSELKFYIDEYRGHRYGSIRTFVRRKNYTGPTKAGVTLNQTLLDGVIEALSKLPESPDTLRDQELSRLPKKAGVTLVVRITIYRDTTGIDLREWVQDINYEGWSKKGVRIPYMGLAQAIAFLKEMKAAL
ncbi:MAG: hypothetical protein HY748_00665 [Elusimicrobia bacterium]|nr:hypothetical protein [Elusimicrobiota bacterium]